MFLYTKRILCRARAEPDGTRAETTFRLSPKRKSPFKSAWDSVQSTVGSRGVRISVSNAGYTTFRGRVRVLATHSIRQFPPHFPSRASPCAITFRTQFCLIFPEVRNVVMFIIIDAQTVFCILCIVKFAFYLRIKFHVSCCSVPLFIP